MKSMPLKRSRRKISRWFYDAPGRLTVLSFMLIIFIGTGLLMLPAASTGDPLSPVNALFMSTSATCVTGLAVIDISTELTLFGQWVIMGLIQVGGLGIMTLSTLILLVAGKRISLMERIVIQDTFTHRNAREPFEIIRHVLLFTLAIEGAGAAVLFCAFLADYGPADALWIAVFHSVSAFCNAGFSLFSDSLCGFRENWVVNITFAALIVTGGIGFLVLAELRGNFPRNRRAFSRLSLHTKLMLSSSVILLAMSTAMILAMEWGNALAPLSVPGRLLAAFFQAVTTRTAGFNSLPVDALADETLFFFILLMFIGAGPGSCAGGVKITTMSTLLLLALQRLAGRDRPRIFNRTIAEPSITKATNVVMMSMTVIGFMVMLMLISESGDAEYQLGHEQFLDIFFEVVSAFGTVGLSMGITPALTDFGKLLITLIMFIGRIGLLVIGMAISLKKKKNFYYAEEEIAIG